MKTRCALLTLATLFATASPTLAAGYFSGAKGARAAGRGGAFTAKADDVTAVAHNPAGLTHIDTTMIQVGNRFSYNANVFQRAPTLDWGNPVGGVPPLVSFEEVRNQDPWQPLEPFLGVATNFGLEDFAFALASFAPAGISKQTFPISGGQRYMMVAYEAVIVNHTLNAAWKYQDLFGLGASLRIVSVPTLNYSLIIDGNVFGAQANPVASQFDMLASISGDDPFTINAVLGAWVRPAPFFEIGLSGQVIPSEIQTKSTLSIRPQTLAAGDAETVPTTRNDVPADDVTLTLPLPLTATIGFRYIHLDEKQEVFDIELDIGYESLSRVDNFTLDTNGLTAELFGQDVPIGVIDVSKQWKDTINVALGSDVILDPGFLTIRGGVFYETALADPAYANVDFSVGQVMGGALGASVFLGDFELAVAHEYRHRAEVTVAEADARVYQQVPGSSCQAPYTDPATCHPEFLGQPAPSVNAGTYRAYSHVTSLDLLYRF